MLGEVLSSILGYTDLRMELRGGRMHVGRNARKVSLLSGEDED